MIFLKNLLSKIFISVWHIPRNCVCLLIKLYQKSFSPDHGIFLKFLFPNGYCKFQPTCSNYSYQAIKKYGIIRGGLKSAWRILKCNPWNEGGYDPVEKN